MRLPDPHDPAPTSPATVAPRLLPGSRRVRRRTVLAAIALAAAAGCNDAHAPQSAGGVVVAVGPVSAQTVTVHGNDRDQFAPQTVRVRVGTVTITLRNGGVPHNLTFEDTSLGAIGTVSGTATKSATVTFSRAGTYAFVCTIHPGMAGKVIVTG